MVLKTFTHTHSKMEKKVVKKRSRLLPNVMKFSAFGQPVFGFLVCKFSKPFVNV
jgi:hypothetical protein